LEIIWYHKIMKVNNIDLKNDLENRVQSKVKLIFSKYRNNKTLIISLILLITISTLVIFYISSFVKNKKSQLVETSKKNVSQSAQLSKIPEEISTNNWKIYTDKNLGFEVKYPNEWGEALGCVGIVDNYSYQGAIGPEFTGDSSKTCNSSKLPTISFSLLNKMQTMSEYTNFWREEQVSSADNKRIIETYHIYKESFFKEPTFDKEIYQAYVPWNGKVLSILLPDVKKRKTFMKIVSSLKVIDQRSVENINADIQSVKRIYTNYEYGISFEYPSVWKKSEFFSRRNSGTDIGSLDFNLYSPDYERSIDPTDEAKGIEISFYAVLEKVKKNEPKLHFDPNKKTLTIAGIQAIQERVRYETDDFINTSFTKDGVTYVFKYSNAKNNKYIDVYNELLSSVKFQ